MTHSNYSKYGKLSENVRNFKFSKEINYFKNKKNVGAAAHTINMPHQKYVVGQMNACKGYNGEEV